MIRRGFTVLEMVLAGVVLLLVVGLLWTGLGALGRGAARAEWTSEASRRVEVLAHRLREEAGRANHLLAVTPDRLRVHDPVLSAVWVLEGGKALAFRVFEPDQALEDPSTMEVERLRQDRVLFALRDRELVMVRRGDLEPEATEVLVRDVDRLEFRAEGAGAEGSLGRGVLAVDLELLRTQDGTRYSRRLSVPVEVPVRRLEVGEGNLGGFLPPPALAAAPEPAARPQGAR